MENLITYHYVNFHQSNALEAFAARHLKSLLKRMVKRSGEPKNIDVQFKLDAKAPLGTVKNSEIKIEYHYRGIAKPFIVKKTGSDLRDVLLECIHALESQVRRATEKLEGSKKTLGRSKGTKIRSLKGA